MPRRAYGPWVGFSSSINRDLVSGDRLTVGSKNIFIDPNNGTWQRRGGTVIFADVAGGGQVGLFESKVGLKARQIMEWKSDSLSDGYPVPALLATNEATGEGAVYFRSTNGGGTNHTVGDDFSTGVGAHYPYDTGNAKAEFIAMPLKQRHLPASGVNTRRYNRFIDSKQRITTAAGARRMIQMAGQAFCPALDGTPWRTYRSFNDSGAAGDQINRILPWGHMPPMGEPAFAFSDAVAANPNWPQSVAFYYTYAFIMEDGSITMPMLPRPQSTLQPAGFLLVSVPIPGGANTGYRILTITNIQRGPKGCVGRLLLRSPTVSGTTGVPSVNDLRIVGILQNNASTTYVDSLGSNADADIVKNPTLVRFDHMWPWRGRYAFKFDERAAIGYLRPTAAAFLCSEWRSSAGTYINGLDEDIAVGTGLAVAVREDQTAALVTNFVTDEGGTETTYNLTATYLTLQDLIDKINVSGAAGGYWRSQLCPGTDLATPTAQLELTQLVIPSTTALSTTLVPQGGKNFNNVAPGMSITDGAVNIPAGTYVASLSGANVIMSQAGTIAGNRSVTFGWDTGDTATFVVGKQRTFACDYAVCLYLKESYVDTFGLFKQRIMFTSGEPGHARNAPQSFYTSNRLNGVDEYGQFMGGAELTSGVIRAIACFSRAICVIMNPKGNSTGLDADYRMIPINLRRGCIASGSVVSGDGWVGYLTVDGYVVTDGLSEHLITLDLFNVSRGLGQLSYEILQCRAAAASDTDGEFFNAVVGEGVLYCSYRQSSAVATCDRIMRYDFGASLGASGLAEVLDKEGQPYGWGTPYFGDTSAIFRPGAMGLIRKGTGGLLYFADDRNQGSTGDGRLEQFELIGTYSDDGTSFQTFGYCRTDRLDTTLKKSLKSVTTLCYKDDGTLNLTLYRSLDRTGPTVVMNFPSTASVTTLMASRFYQEVPMSARTNSDTLELRFQWIDGASPGNFVMYGIEIDADIVESFD